MGTSSVPQILIVDKDNVFASAVGKHLRKTASVIVVSREQVDQENGIVLVPFTLPIPSIPEGVYASIIFIWDTKEKHLLEPLAKKASEQGAHLYVVVRLDEIHDVGEIDYPMSLLVVGDTFGTGESLLDKYLQKAKSSGRVSLPNMGLQSWYPVLYADAAEKIVNIIEHAEKEKKLFIGPRHALTSLSLFHGIQKINPELAIDFSSQHEEEKAHGHHPESAWENYDSIAKLREYYKNLLVKREKVEKEVATVVFSKKTSKKQGGGWVLYVLYIAFVALLLPLVMSLVSCAAGVFLLYQGVQGFQSKDTSLALREIQSAQQNFSLSQSSLDVAAKELGFVGQEQRLMPIKKQITLAQEAATIAENGLTVYQYASNILLGKTLTPKEDSESLASAIKHLSLLLQEVNSADVPKQYQQSLQSLQALGTLSGSVADSIPQVLGANGKRSYLVLFQNNMELRPGGGFIGSYGIVNLDRGAVKDFTIHDVYDADGQLRGHIEPPFAIRRYIPIVHLYLRDSNFDPDFTNNAKTAAQILFQETGERVDGVVGVDLIALKALLGSVGSVYVPSYNQTVTDKNFFQLLEEHAEKNFFPGSTQKKDFLRAFASALLSRLQQKQTLNMSVLLQETVAAVNGKHILIGFNDPVLEEPFLLANVSGSLIDKRTGAGFFDFLGASEANLGVNKANAFVTRGLSQQAVVDEKGNLNGTVSLTLTNNSDGTWPGGVYRNYLRFLVPEKAVLSGITINNQKQQIVDAITDPRVYEAKSFVAPRGLEVAKENEAGKTLIGFLVTVPTQKSISITVSYVIPNAFTISQDKQVYDLLLWKQPGVDAYPFTATFTIPNTFRFLSSNTTENQTVTFAGNMTKDMRFTVPFAVR